MCASQLAIGMFQTRATSCPCRRVRKSPHASPRTRRAGDARCRAQARLEGRQILRLKIQMTEWIRASAREAIQESTESSASGQRQQSVLCEQQVRRMFLCLWPLVHWVRDWVFGFRVSGVRFRVRPVAARALILGMLWSETLLQLVRVVLPSELIQDRTRTGRREPGRTGQHASTEQEREGARVRRVIFQAPWRITDWPRFPHRSV